MEKEMIRRMAGLPIRILKRALDTLSAERNAPSPAPSMSPKAAAPKASAPKASAPKASAPKAPAPKSKKKPANKKSSVSVDAQETPNPNAMKFCLSVTVAETGSFSFNSTDTEIAHPIAAAVVAVTGVVSVFGVKDFITVSKSADANWATVMPAVVDAIKSAV
jgi:hypothetical protein